MKSFQIRSFFLSVFSVFSCIQFEYRKRKTRENYVFEHFSRSGFLGFLITFRLLLDDLELSSLIQNFKVFLLWSQLQLQKARLRKKMVVLARKVVSFFVKIKLAKAKQPGKRVEACKQLSPLAISGLLTLYMTLLVKNKTSISYLLTF